MQLTTVKLSNSWDPLLDRRKARGLTAYSKCLLLHMNFLSFTRDSTCCLFCFDSSNFNRTQAGGKLHPETCSNASSQCVFFFQVSWSKWYIFVHPSGGKKKKSGGRGRQTTTAWDFSTLVRWALPERCHFKDSVCLACQVFSGVVSQTLHLYVAAAACSQGAGCHHSATNKTDEGFS